MIKDLKIILLDFDGTLANTAPVIIQTMQATHQELGLPNRTEKECVAMIGLRLVDIPRVLFPTCNVTGERYAETYRRLFYKFNVEGAVTLYPHVRSTLETLKHQGITLTLASSRSHASLAHYVESLGLSSYISYILGADDVNKGKPAPEPVWKTLEHFHFTPQEALVVGDTCFDLEMGHNAGCLTCGVTYGNGSRESLDKADWMINDFSQLLTIIKHSIFSSDSSN